MLGAARLTVPVPVGCSGVIWAAAGSAALLSAPSCWPGCAPACRIAEKAGFKGVSLHNLRHGHGSQLLSAGVPLPVVSARLGHSSPYVTATIYSHALKADEMQAADKWEAAREKARKAEAARPKN